MGLYDHIRCEYPLPDDPPEWVKEDVTKGRFQTKDTPFQYLGLYIITASGGLVWHRSNPDYTDLVALDDYHGDIRFYTSNARGHDKNGWILEEGKGDMYEEYEYVARFTDGKLSRIWRTPPPPPQEGQNTPPAGQQQQASRG